MKQVTINHKVEVEHFSAPLTVCIVASYDEARNVVILNSDDFRVDLSGDRNSLSFRELCSLYYKIGIDNGLSTIKKSASEGKSLGSIVLALNFRGNENISKESLENQVSPNILACKCELVESKKGSQSSAINRRKDIEYIPTPELDVAQEVEKEEKKGRVRKAKK